MKAEKKKSKMLYKVIAVGFALVFAISSVAFAISVLLSMR
ncbi:hypothetical protein SAMN05216454_10524 [Peptostreptococcus russellii]|uniref:DUF4044 domain-containing protein n=1 Tax=Peptostreptococcus russellii TaxID=215200 RepID=A0A1H8H5X1_9FIRM|nr:hypothetical protein SAMN05216454_10524 [Peptostreptococcus russellii]